MKTEILLMIPDHKLFTASPRDFIAWLLSNFAKLRRTAGRRREKQSGDSGRPVKTAFLSSLSFSLFLSHSLAWPLDNTFFPRHIRARAWLFQVLLSLSGAKHTYTYEKILSPRTYGQGFSETSSPVIYESSSFVLSWFVFDSVGVCGLPWGGWLLVFMFRQKESCVLFVVLFFSSGERRFKQVLSLLPAHFSIFLIVDA